MCILLILGWIMIVFPPQIKPASYRHAMSFSSLKERNVLGEMATNMAKIDSKLLENIHKWLCEKELRTRLSTNKKLYKSIGGHLFLVQPNNSTLTGSVLEWEKVEEVDVCGDGGGGGGGVKFTINRPQSWKMKQIQYLFSVWIHFYVFVVLDVREPKGVQQEAVCKPGGSSWQRL